MHNRKNLCKLMNINYLSLTNQTFCVGKYGLPTIYCNIQDYPDYIALYSQPCEYHMTPNTAVCFYDYDIRFNGKNGLYTAIYYNDEALLAKFKTRFKGVKYFISPDFSMIGDGQMYHNLFNYGISREVALWLTLELGATVIPNIPCCSVNDLEFVSNGIEDVNTIAFSTKGRTDSELDINLIKISVDHIIEKLPNLTTIIVYDTSATDDHVLDLFSSATEKGISLLIPDNSLKRRNSLRGRKNG